MMQKGYAWSTHMTLHNLADNATELDIVAASSCTAQINSNCEAGAEYYRWWKLTYKWMAIKSKITLLAFDGDTVLLATITLRRF